MQPEHVEYGLGSGAVGGDCVDGVASAAGGDDEQGFGEFVCD